MAVCKSPITGSWGDANTGGYFGSELKSAGWDAIFFSGIAPSPQYLMITDEGLALKDASHLWGKDTMDTEDALQSELGDSKIRVACIGPASEKLSLISGIVNDKGRIAARSGVGAVMGSKRLKAVVARGKGKVPISDKDSLDQLRKTFIKEIREAEGFIKILMDYGTCGLTGMLVAGGATPMKNWLLAGEQAFPTGEKITNGDNVLKYQERKYACANCPIACGGIFKVSDGPYKIEELHKPEYETIAAFGTMCMVDDILSVMKLNDMCNRSGLDTISAGSVLAFAMECRENGAISQADTDGIDLTWGNGQAMIAMLDKIVRREGFGDILADGVKIAAQKIGKGAEKYAIHVGGQEPGLHNALFLPGRGTGFVCDPTPGRHTAAPMARLDAGQATIAPYPEMQFPEFERYDYKSKGPASARTSCYWQVGACAGVCLFPVIFFGNYPLIDFLKAVTGWDMDMNEALETGARIQTLRQAFNVREGIKPSDTKLPPRMVGIPPKSDGPLADITIDMDTLAAEYRKAMGWDPETGRPTDATLERLGLKTLTEGYLK
jgi:aldehyde:ferredoxin oxidoreductase